MINPNNIYKKTINIIEHAGLIALDGFNKEKNVKTKIDSSPVGTIDFAIEDYVKHNLKKIFMAHIISEESKVTNYNDRKNLEYVWLLDPLDGTKDYIAGHSDFVISLALLKDNKPIFGIIYAPKLSELYFAIKGNGSFIKSNSIISKILFKKNKYITAGVSRFHFNETSKFFLEKNNIKNKIIIGSALKFCYLARGIIDIYPRFVGSKEWDIAAGNIILQEADGGILDITTNETPVYNKEFMENNHFIAYNKNIMLQDLKLLLCRQ